MVLYDRDYIRDRDIIMALAILEAEYNRRRAMLVNLDLDKTNKDNVLADLETISSSISKIQQVFSQQ